MDESLIATVVEVFEYGGVVVMCMGFVIAFSLAGRRLVKSHSGADAFQVLRRMIGSSILLGLEILVAADLIRTVTSSPSIEDTYILGLTVIIRTILSMSIQIEIEGTLPWKRAGLETGAGAISKTIKDEFDKK